MRITNKNKIAKLKRTFFMVSVSLGIVALVLFLADLTIYGIAMVGVFALWFLYYQVTDFQYIEFSDENNKVVLRYYKAISFGKTEFNSIEFPQQLLQNAFFENSVFGKMTDLTLVIKTKRGMAEYPSVSLTALQKGDRKKIREALFEIINR